MNVSQSFDQNQIYKQYRAIVYYAVVVVESPQAPEDDSQKR